LRFIHRYKIYTYIHGSVAVFKGLGARIQAGPSAGDYGGWG